MNQRQFKLLEKLNDLVNTLDIFSDEPYEKRIRNRYYNELVRQADEIASKLNK